MKNKQIAQEARQTLKNNFKICFLICLLSVIISNVVTLLEKSILTSIVSIALLIITPALSYGIIMCFMKLHNGDSAKVLDFITLGFQNLKQAWAIIFRKLLKLWSQLLLFILGCIIAVTLSFSSFKELLTSSNTPTDLLSLNIYSMFYIFAIFFIILFLYLIFIYPKILYYTFSNYIMIDNNNSIPAKEAVEKSKKLMENNRLKYFKFTLGFIGWYILASITISIISNFIKNILDINNYTIITYLVSMLITPIVTSYVQMANVHFYESLKQENSEI